MLALKKYLPDTEINFIKAISVNLWNKGIKHDELRIKNAEHKGKHQGLFPLHC